MLHCRQRSVLHVQLALQLPRQCLVRHRRARCSYTLCTCTAANMIRARRVAALSRRRITATFLTQDLYYIGGAYYM